MFATSEIFFHNTRSYLKNAAVWLRLPIKKCVASLPPNLSEVATVHRHSFASSKFMYGPRSQSFLHFDDVNANLHGNIKYYCFAFASRRNARVLAEGLPHQNHIQITINQFFCFHKNKLMECFVKKVPMRHRIRSNTQERRKEQYPTLPGP